MIKRSQRCTRSGHSRAWKGANVAPWSPTDCYCVAWSVLTGSGVDPSGLREPSWSSCFLYFRDRFKGPEIRITTMATRHHPAAYSQRYRSESVPVNIAPTKVNEMVLFM